MKSKRLIILVSLWLTAAAYSQNSQTNKPAPPPVVDSVKVAVKDMDAASLKMIEGKKYKEKFAAASKALDACDVAKEQLKQEKTLFEATASDLKKVVVNLVSDNSALKIVAENEKAAKIRRGFTWFFGGVAVGATLVVAVLFLN